MPKSSSVDPLSKQSSADPHCGSDNDDDTNSSGASLDPTPDPTPAPTTPARCRKSRAKKTATENVENAGEESTQFQPPDQAKPPKKRGRKPQGGKIILANTIPESAENVSNQCVILHLKCFMSDLFKSSNNSYGGGLINYPETTADVHNYDVGGETVFNADANTHTDDDINMCFLNGKSNPITTLGLEDVSKSDTSRGYSDCDARQKPQLQPRKSKSSMSVQDTSIDNHQQQQQQHQQQQQDESCKLSYHAAQLNVGDINLKLKRLQHMLHSNIANDNRSSCFWCTYHFDNPAIFIPKCKINESYHVYGCFCSPECAVAFLMNESIDSSAKFERYYLLNHIYGKVYNYAKSIKPSPDPHYTLEKFYGNLTIQEYRSLFNKDRLFLVIDKPITCILPELHDNSDDYIVTNKFLYTTKMKTPDASNNTGVFLRQECEQSMA